ncbi:HAMP domain-containing histidine kinase [Streptomonospora sp. S1-112]|uniref:histidine kinase n=1 Tax=Streptomonospora mangrovi TaxID=2883123 RepID=A0A9X3NNJ7_9ACTN|nr:HAMP domain-containing sensor histidine kinase [Streptomonospora mangrovi]MDA0565321.1 HAMP domain-containing histidine kinase [Streptomonospora mangrovi]
MLANSVLVAVCSVLATAWLAVQGTSESISSQQGETLAVDTRIHNTLVGYAAAHPEWDGVQDAVEDLADETGRRIALTTENRQLLADSAEPGTPLPAHTASVVDPLAVDVTFAPDDTDRIDARAVGPFALGTEDGERLVMFAKEIAACLTATHGGEVAVVDTPSGRPAFEWDGTEPDEYAFADCNGDLLAPTASEQEALDDLNGRIGHCLEPYGLQAEYTIDGLTGTGTVATGPPAEPPGAQPSDEPGAEVAAGLPEATPLRPSDGGSASGVVDEDPADSPLTASLDARTAACVDTARRDQLDPYVAPAALLFIDDPAASPAQDMALSREGLLRVSGVVLLVLVLTVVVSVAVSMRLIRPVHALTDAVQRMRVGDASARVAVRDAGEIGRLGAAFNEMSEHLQRLEEQRKAMVSDVSHELRSPLSNLRGWLEAAQDGLTELDPQLMAMLVEETRLLQRIIDDLRDLALADAGKLRLSPERVEAADLVAQAAASHRLAAESAGLRLTIDAEEGVVLYADRTRVLQAVGNLLGNALRHTPAPGEITVRARGEGDEAVIEVADTGVGIAADDLPHVFSRFWRAEKSRNRKTGGSGLGLAIVRNLTELHGGRATVTSTPGKGSTFTLRLPLTGPRRGDLLDRDR